MKAREYLVSKNLAKPGRGKFSGTAREALTAAIQSGQTFDDYKVEAGTLVKVAIGNVGVKVEKPAGAATERRAPRVQSSDVLEVPAQVWPEDNSHAFYTETGKPCSMKNACNNCSVSLYWCHCSDTHVFDKPVTIVLGK